MRILVTIILLAGLILSNAVCAQVVAKNHTLLYRSQSDSNSYRLESVAVVDMKKIHREIFYFQSDLDFSALKTLISISYDSISNEMIKKNHMIHDTLLIIDSTKITNASGQSLIDLNAKSWNDSFSLSNEIFDENLYLYAREKDLIEYYFFDYSHTHASYFYKYKIGYWIVEYNYGKDEVYTLVDSVD